MVQASDQDASGVSPSGGYPATWEETMRQTLWGLLYILCGLGLPSQEELERVPVRGMSASPSWTCFFCDSITDEQK